MTNNDDGIGFIKVNYDAQQQEEMVFDLILASELMIEDAYSRLSSSDKDSFVLGAAKTLSDILWKFSVFYKHPAFISESEWRVVKNITRNNSLLSSQQPPILFRLPNKVFTPYIEVNFSSRANSKQIPLEQVILGPKHQSQDLQSLRMYLETKGYYIKNYSPDLKVSEIPYR